MTFLDEAPLDFSRPEVQELHALLVLAYSNPAEAKQLAYSAGLVVGTFPERAANMRNLWFDILGVMSHLKGGVRQLVQETVADPTVSAYHDRFRQMLGDNPPVMLPSPLSSRDWWRGDDRTRERAVRLLDERLIEKQNRLFHLDVARGVVALAPSVARLEMTFSHQRAHGTGFLIQPDLLLTNHHNLFDSAHGPAHHIVAIFDDERGHPGPCLTVLGDPTTIRGDRVHDWAVIRLAQTVARPPLRLGTPFAVSLNDPLIIIQHPLGGPKQFAIDPLAVRNVDDDIVHYVADTQKGSSGSPVFNTQLHLIALHHAEVESEIEGRPETVWHNEGVRIGRIMAALADAGIPFETV